MNNPFGMFQNKDTQTEQESSRLRLRLTVLLGLFACLLLAYVGVLVNVQLINGEKYLDNSSYTVVQSETIKTDRGDILDRNGNLWVTNEIQYNIVLDVSLMGSDRNRILSELIELCRQEGVTWTDTFPVSISAPWSYTREAVFAVKSVNDDGETVYRSTYLGQLSKRLKWISNPETADLSAKALMEEMMDTFIEKGTPLNRNTRALLGVLYEIYLRTYEFTYNQYVFAHNVDIGFITKIKERSLPGVEIETVTTRRYMEDSAPHVLGITGPLSADQWATYRDLGYPMDAVIGQSGVEQAFEKYLHNASGVRRVEMDDSGNIISESWSTEPQPGSNVVLTLDQAVQTVAEEQLAQFVTALEDPAGAAAVMIDVNNGGVIALASYPDYNLSTYYEDYAQLATDPAQPYNNRATFGLYSPGSTYKPLVAIAALTEGIINPRSIVICTGRYYHYDDYQPVCWIYTNTGGTHGTENVSEAITDSCNIFFYDVGRRLGITSIVDYATKFGLGQKTGIEIGEYQGRVAGPETSALLGEQWYGGDVLSASIGQQKNQFTPLQLANYIATLVNGGNHYEVHLLKEVKSYDYSEVLYEHQPVLKDVIDINPTALAAVKKGMYDLSKTRTMSPYFGNLPFEVGCKTGTAEVAGSSANAVFVCFAPYDNPQVALCIVAEKGASGGSLASIAAAMLSQYFVVNEAQSGVDTENSLIH